jgi:hypothetical protein
MYLEHLDSLCASIKLLDLVSVTKEGFGGNLNWLIQHNFHTTNAHIEALYMQY